MSTIKLKINNETGLHARPATLFARTAQEYESTITIIHGELDGNAKSLLSILSLGICQGQEIIVKAEGIDAQQALEALQALVDADFEVAKFTVSDGRKTHD